VEGDGAVGFLDGDGIDWVVFGDVVAAALVVVAGASIPWLPMTR